MEVRRADSAVINGFLDEPVESPRLRFLRQSLLSGVGVTSFVGRLTVWRVSLAGAGGEPYLGAVYIAGNTAGWTAVYAFAGVETINDVLFRLTTPYDDPIGSAGTWRYVRTTLNVVGAIIGAFLGQIPDGVVTYQFNNGDLLYVGTIVATALYLQIYSCYNSLIKSEDFIHRRVTTDQTAIRIYSRVRGYLYGEPVDELRRRFTARSDRLNSFDRLRAKLQAGANESIRRLVESYGTDSYPRTAVQSLLANTASQDVLTVLFVDRPPLSPVYSTTGRVAQGVGFGLGGYMAIAMLVLWGAIVYNPLVPLVGVMWALIASLAVVATYVNTAIEAIWMSPVRAAQSIDGLGEPSVAHRTNPTRLRYARAAAVLSAVFSYGATYAVDKVAFAEPSYAFEVGGTIAATIMLCLFSTWNASEGAVEALEVYQGTPEGRELVQAVHRLRRLRASLTIAGPTGLARFVLALPESHRNNYLEGTGLSEDQLKSYLSLSP